MILFITNSENQFAYQVFLHFSLHRGWRGHEPKGERAPDRGGTFSKGVISDHQRVNFS